MFAILGVLVIVLSAGAIPIITRRLVKLLPPRDAGAKIGLVVSATIFGMAFGGYISGVIFDLTSSYRMAFLNGVLWNAFNFAIVGWLFWRRQRRAPRGQLVEAA